MGSAVGRDVVIGRILRPHGIAGELVVEPLTDFPERFREGETYGVTGVPGLDSLRIASARWHLARVLVRFDGFETRNQAETLRGAELTVGLDAVAPRPTGFAYHFELEGCGLYDRTGSRLGTVTALIDAGGRPLLEVETPAGSRLVPFVAPIVVEVDVAARRVTVDAPAGLLE